MKSFERPNPVTPESSRGESPEDRQKRERMEALRLLRDKFPGHQVGYVQEDPTDGALLFGEPPTGMDLRTIFRVVLPGPEGGEPTIVKWDVTPKESPEDEDPQGAELEAA